MVADILAKGISEEDINLAVHSLRNALTVAFLPHGIHETNPSNNFELCVESVAGNALDEYLSFHPGFEVKYKRQMPLTGTIHVDGVVSGSSSTGGIVYCEVGVHKVGVGINELKETVCAPLEQLGQAYAKAVNLVLGQLKMGLPSENCCVAMMLTNGQLYQFGFVTLLYPSFPVVHLSSPVIDTADSHGMKTAAPHLHRYREF